MCEFEEFCRFDEFYEFSGFFWNSHFNSLLILGAKICFDFVQELESFGVKIKIINIGGGLSSSYSDPEEPKEFSFAHYRKALEVEIPQLFSGKYQIVTEFGRSLLLKV